MRGAATAHGPLVDVGWTPDSAGRALALRWVAQDSTSDEVGALLGFGRATTLAQFQAAAGGFRSPEQNVVYGDADGTSRTSSRACAGARHGEGHAADGGLDRRRPLDALSRDG